MVALMNIVSKTQHEVDGSYEQALSQRTAAWLLFMTPRALLLSRWNQEWM